MTPWPTHPAQLVAADIRAGDLVWLVGRWWPVGHTYRDGDEVELDLLEAGALTVPRQEPLLTSWQPSAATTPASTSRSRSSAAR